MKRSISLKLSLSLLALPIAGSALSGSLTPAQMEQAAQRDVIVILRDQLAGAPAAREAMEARASAVAAAQVGVLAQLQRTGNHKVHSFQTINAFSARLSPSEVSTLANHPDVLSVVPDRVIRLKRSANTQTPSGAGSATASAPSSTSGLCGTLEPEALQLTYTAFLDPSVPQAQEVIDGNGQKVTGKGVKVAWIADGIDINTPGFIRPDGSHVFVDYQDFSGDPAGTPTDGGEAFLDASSIAAQDVSKGAVLTYDISKYVNQAHPLPSPCNIRIRGMAPGASLVGLKVFSNLGYTTTSSFVQAIEYAVVHDKVDVINESFGGNPYPDDNNDPITLADNAAIAAGVTVVVSSGDGGPTGTLGSPSTATTGVIAAGASTQFRSYVQTAYGAQTLATGYISNNISALSSGGYAQRTPRTVDVVAPGDLGWALCSPNDTLYMDCTNYQTPAVGTPIQLSGGTSESAPLTSGEAALIIQAYRSTHHGASPSPHLVRRIIMSTATDLESPAFEQGAGLINALKAVNTALSIEDEHGDPKARGEGLLADPSSARIEGLPGSSESRTFTLTNEGNTTRQIQPKIEVLSGFAGATLSVNLNPASDPTFINPTGSLRSYIEKKFTVPAGADHLDAAIAWQVSVTSAATPIAYLALLDPSGRQAAYSLPQGLGSGYGHVDVGHPTPGKWTAIIWTRPSGTGSYSGPVQFSWSAERYVSAGAVHPATLHLKPGASATFTADFDMPAEPGDSSVAIRFIEATGDTFLPALPVSLRTLIPTSATGGAFTGTLTGGNGRAGVGPYQTFEFDVPKGVANMSLNFEIPDNGYLLEGLLIDPNGMQLSVAPNIDPFGDPQFGMGLSHYDPQPGRWKFVLVIDTSVSGNQTSLEFTARIGFNTAEVSASGLPNSANKTLSASAKPVNVQVSVTNTGPVTAAYFADARLNGYGLTTLTPQACDSFTTLPGTCGLFYLPTESSAVAFLAQSTLPINMDVFNDVGYNSGATGNPDLWAKSIGSDTVLASLVEPEVPWGAWIAAPALIGPFGPTGAPTAPVDLGAFVLTQPFDAAVSASSGDIWADLTLGTSTFNPLILAPGESGTITLTITPDPTQVGNPVSGFVYIDTFNAIVGTGDEVMRLPYSYTVSK